MESTLGNDPVIDLIKQRTKTTITRNIYKFLSSPDCCMEFPKYLDDEENLYIQEVAESKDLGFQVIEVNKYMRYVKVFKQCCNTSFKEDATFQLHELSKKEIVRHLQDNLHSDAKEDNFETESNVGKPRIPIFKICMGSSTTSFISVPPKGNMDLNFIQKKMGMPIYKYRQQILNTINENQITFICGDVGYEKPTQVPQYLLEDATERNNHCAIICVQTNRLIALYNSEAVIAERGENIGGIIGFQAKLESMSSIDTNLLYTTTDFILRCFMGLPKKEFLKEVSHIIIDDIHLRYATSDMLLLEVKEALTEYPHLKLVLMSNSLNVRIFEEYFKKGVVIKLESLKRCVYIYHLDEILLLTNYVSKGMIDLLSNTENGNNNGINLPFQKTVDTVLENYVESGSELALNYFLYLVEVENIPIDICHSENGTTALLAAIRYDNLSHVTKLLDLNADVFKIDLQHLENNCAKYIQDRAKQIITTRELSTIGESLLYAYEKSRVTTGNVDHELVHSVVSYVHKNLGQGTILVFLPSYMDMLKQQFLIQKSMLEEGRDVGITIHLLHENMQKADLQVILESGNITKYRKIILSTEIAESFNITDVMFIIDTGKMFTENNNGQSPATWISKDSLDIRTSMICGKEGHYFRLFRKNASENFPQFAKPELLSSDLHRIALKAKVLSPYLLLSDYFHKLVQSPPSNVIEESVNFLKEIGAIDETEMITSLAVRLIEIPVDIQLGKVLIYGIVLQCLEPILTIVSALSVHDPLDWLNDPQTVEDTAIERRTLSEGTNSDHIILLRLYQKWQSGGYNKLDNFVLNGALEQIGIKRTQIIGALRATGLIHSAGILSMQFINENANNWPLVKACFVGGMYPNVCRVDKNLSRIKSRLPQKIILHPSSVLRDLYPSYIQQNCQTYHADWIVYQYKNIIHSNINTKWNSVVTAASIALFSGDMWMRDDDIFPIVFLKNNSKSGSDQFIYRIDEWISFTLQEEEAYLLYNLRKRFFSLLKYIIDECNECEKFRKTDHKSMKRLSILSTISKILNKEDITHQFSQPKQVGLRPKPQPIYLHSNFSNLEQSTINDYFFIIIVGNKNEVKNFELPGYIDEYTNILNKYKENPLSNIFVFLYVSSEKVFKAVGRLDKTDKNKHVLKDLTKTEVCFNQLKSTYLLVEEDFKNFNDGDEISQDVGSSFFYCFKNTNKVSEQKFSH